MSDDRIKAVLARAALDRAFHDALSPDRAGTLAKCDLSEAERAMLEAASDVQLASMIEEARKQAAGTSAPRGGASPDAHGPRHAAGGRVPQSFGLTAEAVDELAALRGLAAIAEAERAQRARHGRYAPLDALEGESLIEHLAPDAPYGYEVELGADTFTATARHRTRPDTRPAFRVGPDGEVKPLE